VEEAYAFSPEIVPYWIEASHRGLEVLLAVPSTTQLKLLSEQEYSEIKLTTKCTICHQADAVTPINAEEEQATIAICETCFTKKTDDAKLEIVERLQKEHPFPGDAALYQPVEIPECNDWRIARPDCYARADAMKQVIAEVGLISNGFSGRPSYFDIGCNTGFFCNHFAQLGFRSKGVDATNNFIAVAKLLDSFIRRPQRPSKEFVMYELANAYEYLSTTHEERFDVTSALGVIQWLMIQRSVDHGIACLEWLFAKTKRVCFLEMGYSAEELYKDQLKVNIDRSWVLDLMERKGNFSEIRVLNAKEHDLQRDLFVGIKFPTMHSSNGRSTAEDHSTQSPQRVERALEKIEGLVKENEQLKRKLEAVERALEERFKADTLAAELVELSEKVEIVEASINYIKLQEDISGIVKTVLPNNCTVLVVSKGDDKFLKLNTCTSWHFPQAENGSYAGCYPAESSEAVLHLEALRARGAQYLLFPSTAFWWLDCYEEFRHHLESSYQTIWSGESCLIYQLASPSTCTTEHTLDRLVWQNDRVLLDDIVFRLEPKSNDWELGDECFVLYKWKDIVNQYARFLTSRREFQPQNVFELGLWDDGSAAFWFECFKPKKHVAIDIMEKENSEYFRRYVQSRDLTGRIKTFWGVDQSDSKRLLEIVDEEFDAPLDLVIDDASHLFGHTLSSFETLFPLLRPGGLYFIEDWAWAYQPHVLEKFPRYLEERPLADLVFQLVQAAGTPGALIKSLVIYPHFVVVERGRLSTEELSDFKLVRHIHKREDRRLSER